jgi:TatD DNase family protein
MYINIHTHKPTLTDCEVQSLNVGEQAQTTYFSCGYHPWFIVDEQCNIEALRHEAIKSNCIAIGEIGLDKLKAPSLNIQTHYLEQQFALATELVKPVIIHNVKSTSEILGLLAKYKSVRAVFHGFNLKLEIAKLILDAGHQLSFGKHILVANSNAQLALKICAGHQFFLETDDANIAISDVYKAAAQLRDISLATFQAQILQNFNATFATSI